MPLIAVKAQARKNPTAVSWWMNETNIKVRGKWTYQYHAVDRSGKTVNFMSSERRNTVAARRFFMRAFSNNCVPERMYRQTCAFQEVQ